MRTMACVLGVSVALLSTSGCAGSSGGVRPSSPFTAEDARLFDDAVDMLADPGALEGKWASDWDAEMRARTEGSDLIVLATVTTLRTDVDPQGKMTYRVVVTPDAVWKGTVPSGGLTLSVDESSPGYTTVDTQKQNMLNQAFVVFVKWYTTPEGKLDAHWHLSVASEGVRTRVRAEIDKAAPTHTTIVKTHVN